MLYDYLQLSQEGKKPLYQQLYEAVKEAVETGRLKKGERMPSIRRLSEDLKLSRTTIETAYQQLCVEGFIKSYPQKGYFVSLSGYSAAAAPVKKQRLTNTAPPVRYNLGSDSVDSALIDLKRFRGNVKDVLNRQEILSSYGEHQGEAALREALSNYSYSVRGVVADSEGIVIGAGTQPLLYLLCGLLLDEERLIALEAPGFRQAEQVFSDCRVAVQKISADEDGVNIAELDASQARVAMVNPSSSTHTGKAIPMSRRLELLSWAQRRKGYLIEDDYNGELRYNARPIPAMQGLPGGERVVYLGSFSKLLLPSVRIGYMVLPPALLARYRERAARYNQTASKIEQLALADYIREGKLERQLRRMRKLYALKSERFAAAVKREFGNKAALTLQETALCYILSINSEKNARQLCELAVNRGVRVTAQSAMPPQSLVLVRTGFGGIPMEEIDPAVKALYRAWKDVIY